MTISEIKTILRAQLINWRSAKVEIEEDIFLCCDALDSYDENKDLEFTRHDFWFQRLGDISPSFNSLEKALHYFDAVNAAGAHQDRYWLRKCCAGIYN